ncbi:MAG: FAD-dependent oxidoreductase [Thermodesulfobacteriota bacterium]|nr:FAD-dependent oxidoreductase [Thermodesulfobacteriota bacterium]
MTDTTYLIIGGSAAGMAAAHTIRQLDPDGALTVLSDEPEAPYFRPLIPLLVSGKKDAADMAMNGAGPYREAGISIHTGCRAEKVQLPERTVVLNNGHTIAFEKVLFATGSRPYIPPDLAGADAPGVFALRTLEDARNMTMRLEKTRHAVMLGGGLLNLKAAFALLEKGVKVTLAVRSPEILSQLMEPEDTGRIRSALDAAGLTVMTGLSVKGIVADSRGVTGVALNDGRELPCEMVCIGKGVRPNVEFLKGSGIQTDGGIVADIHTACNLADTFTAGDVAVTHDPMSGDRIMTALWTNAVEMGRCAGRNMADFPTAYTGTFGVLNATQVADEPFVSMGTVHVTESDLEVHRSRTDSAYRKIVFNQTGDRLIGALFSGDITNAGLYRYVIREKMPVSSFKQHLVDHTLHYGHLAMA